MAKLLKKHKKSLIIMVLIVTAVISYIALTQINNESDLADIEFEIARKKDLQQMIITDGQVVSGNMRTIMAPSSGELTELKVELNHKIEKDTLLAVIESTDQQGNTREQEIVSPINGTVVKLPIQANQMVMTGQTQLMTIADLDKLEIKTSVGEVDINKIKVDQKAKLEFPAFEDLSVNGVVTFIAEAPYDELTTNPTYMLTIEMDEVPDGLKFGMTCNVDIVIDEREDVLVVSDLYIFEEDNKNYVKTYEQTTEDFEIKDVEITIGLQGETEVEVLSGIVEGTKLILPTTETETSRIGIFGFRE